MATDDDDDDDDDQALPYDRSSSVRLPSAETGRPLNKCGVEKGEEQCVISREVVRPCAFLLRELDDI